MRSGNQARVDQRGFTLAELLVVIAIVGLIMAGLLTLMKRGNESYLAGANQVEAQSAGRATLERMTQEVREAGYNPQGLPPCVGLVPPACMDAIINQTPTTFIIQNDWDGNGTINNAISICMTYSWAACPNPGGPNNRGEQITYSLVGGTLNRQESGPAGGGNQALMTSVAQAICGPPLVAPDCVAGVRPFFQYLDANGCVIGACGAPPTTQADIRTVVVNFRVGVQNTAPVFWQAGAVSVTMSDRIRLRNRIP